MPRTRTVSAAAIGGAIRGSSNENVAPPPGVSLTCSVPPCFRAITNADANPRPVPPVVPLVVKKGSKICSRSVSGTPGPRSMTRQTTCWSTASTDNTTAPPGGVTSRALIARFMSSRSIWERSIMV